MLCDVCSILNPILALIELGYATLKLVCTVVRSANMVDANVLSKGFSLLSTMFCTLNIRMMFPIVWRSLSNMELMCAFLFAVISLNHGFEFHEEFVFIIAVALLGSSYLVRQARSTWLDTNTAWDEGAVRIYIQPVAQSIIVTD